MTKDEWYRSALELGYSVPVLQDFQAMTLEECMDYARFKQRALLASNHLNAHDEKYWNRRVDALVRKVTERERSQDA